MADEIERILKSVHDAPADWNLFFEGPVKKVNGKPDRIKDRAAVTSKLLRIHLGLKDPSRHANSRKWSSPWAARTGTGPTRSFKNCKAATTTALEKRRRRPTSRSRCGRRSSSCPRWSWARTRIFWRLQTGLQHLFVRMRAIAGWSRSSRSSIGCS